MDLYRDIILDHYKNPRNFGHLDKPDVIVQEYNSACGDRIVMEIHFEIQNSKFKVRDIRFNGEGCAISQASSSMLTEKVKNMGLDEVLRLSTEDVLHLLNTELTPSRIKCAVLPLEVIQKGIVEFKNKANK